MARTEKWPSQNITFTNDSNDSATRVFHCPWSDMVVEKTDLLNSTFSDENFLFSTLRCVSVKVDKLGDADSGGGPKQAVLTAEYSGNDDSSYNYPGGGGGGSLTENIAFSGQALTLGEGLYWDAAHKEPLKEASQVMIIPQAEISYSGTVSDINVTEIKDVIGKVNSDTFNGWEKESLLFMGVDAQRVTPNGTVSSSVRWDVQYKLIYNPYTWNKFYNADTNAFAPVFNKAGAETDVYDLSSDFGEVIF